jgi:hypothetical protein
MLRAILLAALLACVGTPALAFSWSVYSDPSVNRTLRGYAKASTSRSCLTGDTRAVLARLERAVGRVSIVSTCRPGARIAGSGRQSKHAIGRAVDFNTRNKGKAIAFLRSQGVFVMTYCGMSHVHFNTGQSGASFCGSKARYVSARKKWRRR